MTCLSCQQKKWYIMCWRGLNKFNNARYATWKVFDFSWRLTKQMTGLPYQQDKCHIICWRGLNKFNNACYVSRKAILTMSKNQASCKPDFTWRLAQTYHDSRIDNAYHNIVICFSWHAWNVVERRPCSSVKLFCLLEFVFFTFFFSHSTKNLSSLCLKYIYNFQPFITYIFITNLIHDVLYY